MADTSGGDELEHGVQHPESGPQHGNDDDVAADPSPGSRTERRVQSRAFRRDVAQCLRNEQHADPIGGLAEVFGCRPLVAKRGERVVRQRMIDEVKRHGHHYTQRA